jgi:hypothetical protein
MLAMRVIKRPNSAVQEEGLTSRLQLGMIIATSQMLSVMRQIGRRQWDRRARKERTLFLICPQLVGLVDVPRAITSSSDLEMYTCTVGET